MCNKIRNYVLKIKKCLSKGLRRAFDTTIRFVTSEKSVLSVKYPSQSTPILGRSVFFVH